MNVAALLLVSAFAAYVQDGREWEDHLRQSHGKEPPHAAFGSFPDSAAARAVISSRSPWTVSLDSETAWRFKWSRRPSERPKGFEREGFDDSGWDIAKVPCSWQAMGIRKSGERFGVPIYLNQEYIFTPKFPANSNCWPKVTGHDLPRDWTFSCKDNPVGSYRREFSLDECWPDWAGERIVLRFDGVESFFYVYVNGQCLGYSKDSRDVSEFDITDVVRPGRNILAVEVYRNCDGSYLECQDMFRLSGIHRSVWLCRTPKTFIRDVGVTVAPASDGIYDGEWNVDVDVKIGGGTAAPKVEVSAPGGGSAVFKGGAFDAGGRTRLVFARPRLWSAETPELYTLVVSLERGGRTLTAAGFDLGFRESTIREGGTAHDRIYVFNGKAVKLKGVNRGECDPMFGHHVPAANIEADLKLIKRGNFNFVRNSHFPQTEYFYYLANRIGLYVMDEANIESHGYRYGKESLSHVRSWRDAHLARVRSMFMRSRNQPSVVLWSLGNEAGPGDNFRTCHDFIRSRDKMRPISYERNNEIADFGSCMYPTLELAHGIAIADGDVRLDNLPVRYPFLFIEYAHNLNSNCGNLDEYQSIIESSERMMGGALWDFLDQALWMRGKDGVAVAAWGGCFDEKPEGGQGMMDGIVTCDRRPEPGYFEAKHVFRPIVTALGSGNTIVVSNRYDFIGTENFDCKYEVLRNGRTFARGLMPVDVAPRMAVRRSMPESVNDAVALGGEVALKVSFALRRGDAARPAGWTVAEDQLQVADGNPPWGIVWDDARRGDGATTAARLSENSKDVMVAVGGLEYGFSRSSGELVSLKRGGVELLASAMTLDCFRAPVGGESRLYDSPPCFVRQRLMDGLRMTAPNVRSFKAETDSEGRVLIKARVEYRPVSKEDAPRIGHDNRIDIFNLGKVEKDAPWVDAESQWTFGGVGGASLRSVFRQRGKPVELQRIGWRLVFRERTTEVEYFARGPFDNYCDRKNSSFPAVYSAFSDTLGFRYGVNQDSGNREDARYVILKSLGLGFVAGAGRRFAFAVSPYSPTELICCPHTEELPSTSRTELGLYAKVRGLGSANCGPPPKPSDCLVAHGEWTLEVRMGSTCSVGAMKLNPHD